MSQAQREITVAEHVYPYTLRRSRRAKHLLLHVSVDRGIEVVVPWNVPYKAGERFLRSKDTWLQGQLRRYHSLRAEIPRRSLTTGESLPLFGETLTLTVAIRPGRSRVARRDESVYVQVSNRDKIAHVLERWYRQQARQHFAMVCRELGQRINTQPTGIRISAARSQWGSCSGRGVLSFTWRLVLAPQFVADYVAAHEVAHLLHRNHTKRFWSLVDQLHSETEKAQKWLKIQGHTLLLTK